MSLVSPQPIPLDSLLKGKIPFPTDKALAVTVAAVVGRLVSQPTG